MMTAIFRAGVRWSVWLALAGLLALSTSTGADEVPFITSPDHVTLEMLRIAGVKRGDHVIDLGSGDGRIVMTCPVCKGTGKKPKAACANGRCPL